MFKFRALVAGLLVAAPLTPSVAEVAVAKVITRSIAVSTVDVRPDVFGSIALPLKQTRFDARWQRVMASASAARLAPTVRPARALARVEQLQFVNASLNERIRYKFDTDPSGDHWATANETLRLSAGDCEDIVIAKMQTLRALGVPERDLYMTIGHDVAVGSVHAVLLARIGGQFWVLDNRTNKLIPQQNYPDFHPILTFSSGSTWLHGYKLGQTPDAVRRLGVALNAKRELALGSSPGSVSGSVRSAL